MQQFFDTATGLHPAQPVSAQSNFCLVAPQTSSDGRDGQKGLEGQSAVGWLWKDIRAERLLHQLLPSATPVLHRPSSTAMISIVRIRLQRATGSLSGQSRFQTHDSLTHHRPGRGEDRGAYNVWGICCSASMGKAAGPSMYERQASPSWSGRYDGLCLIKGRRMGIKSGHLHDITFARYSSSARLSSSIVYKTSTSEWPKRQPTMLP